jgi:uncharacterized surface protein with fasciclin (FAS1) repeats
MRTFIGVFAVLALVFATIGCERQQQKAEETEEAAAEGVEEMAEGAEEMAEEAEEMAEEEMAEEEDVDQTIVEVAEESGSFETLVSAIKKAELVDALNAEGPYTVFAPNDEAFDKLPEQTLTNLLKAENKAKLQSILKYHVIEGKVMAADVESGEVETLQGDEAMVEVGDDGVTYAGAKVAETDIEASNGVIHVIDEVVMPPEKKEPTN